MLATIQRATSATVLWREKSLRAKLLVWVLACVGYYVLQHVVLTIVWLTLAAALAGMLVQHHSVREWKQAIGLVRVDALQQYQYPAITRTLSAAAWSAASPLGRLDDVGRC